MALVLDGDSGIVGVLATNADGDVIIDTNTFFVDAVTNRVGIGSITPENTLHVVSGDNQQMLVQNSATGDASIKFNRSGQTFFIGIESSDNSFRISDGGVGLGTDDRLVIDPSGNVGINTTIPNDSPVGTFNWAVPVTTISGTRPTLYLNGSDSITTIRLWPNGDDGAITTLDDWHINALKNSNGGILKFAPQGGSLGNAGLSLKNNGNVGIGTNNPAASLDLGSNTDAIILPSGTDAQQPSSPVTGSFRYNTTSGAPEFRSSSAWISLGLKDGSSQQLAAASAQDIKTLTGTNVDGAYWIKPVGSPTAFQVHCYMSIEGGGWMLTLRNTSNELGPFSSGDFLVANWAGWAYNSKSQIDALGFDGSTAADTNCFTPVYALSSFTDVMVIANRSGQQSRRVGWQHSGGFTSMYAAINDSSEKVATSVLFGNAYNWLSSLDVRSDTNIGGASNDRVGFKIRADSGSSTSASNYTGGFWTSTMHYGSQIGCGRNNQTSNVFGGGFGGNYSNGRWHRNNGHWWNHGDGRSSAAWNASDHSSAFYGHAVYIR
jgi:hypothetical protein